MITASEARINVAEFRANQHLRIEKILTPIMEEMNKTIEFHSCSGLTQAEFCPYSKSRFSTVMEIEIASKILSTKLKHLGYEILINNINDNILRIKW